MIKYQHVERLQTGDPIAELQGLNLGEVYAFTKLDGANHSIWYDEDKGCVKCSSRNQEVNEGWDSTGFYRYFKEHPQLEQMVLQNKDFVFYGEYLTKHTIRDYEDSAYGGWYLFDMYDKKRDVYLPYTFYSDVVKCFGVECIPPICTLVSPTFEEMKATVDNSTFLHNGQPGEGVVFKNYNYRNIYGRQTWGKIVREDFKINSKSKNKGQPVVSFEERMVRDLMTEGFVYKEAYKMIDETGEPWRMNRMPEIIKRAWVEFVKDYATDIMGRCISEDVDSLDVRGMHKAANQEIARYMKKFNM